MEFSNYVESRTPVGTADGTELIPVSKAGSPASMTSQQIADLAGDEHFKGVYANLGALTTAHATANEGDYALVDTGGSEAALYIWDDTDTEWVASGVTTVVPDASETVKGIGEIATQAETNTGTDDVRFITPLKAATRYQVLDSDLTAIAALTPSNDDVLQRKSGAWTNRTVAQLQADLISRVQSVVSAATVTPNANTDDMVKITAQAAALALANPSGTPTEGQGMVIRIKDNGTARAISYDTQYRQIGVVMPLITVISKTTYIAMIYNATDSMWDVIFTKTQV
jgi:hypothetical protein